MMREAVFVIDGHDIELYPDAGGAARSVEGYDAPGLDYVGADGAVYTAIVKAPDKPVILHRTQENRLDDLVRLLRTEAVDRGLALPPDTPDEPEVIWGALLAAQQEIPRPRRKWWRRRVEGAPPIS